jgi:hypothetical protein
MFALILLAACLMYGLFFSLMPPVVQFVLSNEQHVVIWSNEFAHKCRWLLIGIGMVLSCLAVATGSMRKENAAACSRADFFIHNLMPVSLFPLCGIVILLGDMLPRGIVSNTLWFGPALILSLILAQLVEEYARNGKAAPGRPVREWTLLIFVASTILYTCLGCRLAYVAGEHAGDEGQYLAEARSLYYDHDLDIKNNFLQENGQFGRDFQLGDRIKEVYNEPLEKIRLRLLEIHVSTRSRNGHWYSIHPYGLPLLMAPFWPLGIPMRYFILGMIGALGNIAMYKISRRLGAGRNAAMITVLCFGASFYWAVYAARALPETLGATLLCWAFWAILVQDEKPWLSVIVGSVCCTYLTMAHDRFIVLSLLAFGFYGLFGLFSGEPWSRKLKRLTVFTILTCSGYAIYVASQFHMYEGGLKYELSEQLFNYPMGMWGIIADLQGVTPVLPSFIWLAAALMVWVLMRGISLRTRLFAVAVAVTFAACVVSSCANEIYVGGSCVPGRYLLVVVALLVPGAACVLERTTSTGRWWYVFLSSVSAMLLVLTLIFLPLIGRGFIMAIFRLAACHPILAGLFNPHASFLYSPQPRLEAATTAYVAGGILLTALALMLTEKHRRYALLPISLVIALGIYSNVVQGWTKPDRYALPRYLSGIEHEKLVISKLDAPTDLLKISRVYFDDFAARTSRVGVTTADLGTNISGRMASQPNMATNDWAGRGYAWTTLTAPFKPFAGQMLLHMAGVIEGDAVPVLALKQGSRPIFEGPIQVSDGQFRLNYVFRCGKSEGDLYILVRLADGHGTLTLKEFSWTPYSNKLLEGTNILLPKDTMVVGK